MGIIFGQVFKAPMAELLPFLAAGLVIWSFISSTLTEATEVFVAADLKAKYPQAEFVDARGGVIMPGLINAHTHIYSALARGLSISALWANVFIVTDDRAPGAFRRAFSADKSIDLSTSRDRSG